MVVLVIGFGLQCLGWLTALGPLYQRAGRLRMPWQKRPPAVVGVAHSVLSFEGRATGHVGGTPEETRLITLEHRLAEAERRIQSQAAQIDAREAEASEQALFSQKQFSGLAARIDGSVWPLVVGTALAFAGSLLTTFFGGG